MRAARVWVLTECVSILPLDEELVADGGVTSCGLLGEDRESCEDWPGAVRVRPVQIVPTKDPPGAHTSPGRAQIVQNCFEGMISIDIDPIEMLRDSCEEVR